MAGKKAERNLVPIGLRVEPEIADRLRAAGGKLSDEVRQRLEQSFKRDALDPATREVSDLVIALADKLKADYGATWHQSLGCHQAFVATLKLVLNAHEPKPELPVGASALMEPNIPPDILGQIRLQDIQREHSYPRLEAAQRSRARRQLSSRHIKARRGDNET